CLRDEHAEIRRHAIALGETSALGPPSYDRDLAASLVTDTDARVRFQLGLSAAWNPMMLLSIAQRDPSDPWIRIAVLISSRTNESTLADHVLNNWHGPEKNRSGRVLLLRGLCEVLGADAKTAQIVNFLASIKDTADEDLVFAALSGLGQGLARHREKLGD